MSAQKFRIVAVDDDPNVLKIIQYTLGQSYEVITVSDPKEVFQVIDCAKPDLLIADIMMPGITGYTIVEELRRSERHQFILTLFISGKDTDRDVRYGFRVGVDSYVTKPFQPVQLAQVVQQLLAPLGAPRPHELDLSEIELAVKSKGCASVSAGSVGGV